MEELDDDNVEDNYGCTKGGDVTVLKRIIKEEPVN